MSWPFVSRDHYDYMRETLEKRVSDLDSERKALLDYILERSAGSKLFDDVARGTVTLPPGPGFTSVPFNETAEFNSPTRQTARTALRKIQEQIEQETDEAQEFIRKTAEEAKAATQ